MEACFSYFNDNLTRVATCEERLK
eukprot:COSAG03_NODE_14143_length_475_cov_1.005319_1_plen_23_part_10